MTAIALTPELTVSGATGGREIGSDGPLVVLTVDLD